MKKMSVKVFVFVMMFVFMNVYQSQAVEDKGGWHGLKFKLYENEYVKTDLFLQYRSYHDYKDTQRNFYSLKTVLKHKFFDAFKLGVNYAWFQHKKNNTVASRSEFKWQQRLEFEVNPVPYKVCEWLTISNRNRIEFRWQEDKGAYNQRTRNLIRFTIPLKDRTPIKQIKSIYFDTEFFYNISEHGYDEQRTIPAGINLALNKNVDFQLYYMIQTKAVSSDLSNRFYNHILGTNITLKW